MRPGGQLFFSTDCWFNSLQKFLLRPTLSRLFWTFDLLPSVETLASADALQYWQKKLSNTIFAAWSFFLTKLFPARLRVGDWNFFKSHSVLIINFFWPKLHNWASKERICSSAVPVRWECFKGHSTESIEIQREKKTNWRRTRVVLTRRHGLCRELKRPRNHFFGLDPRKLYRTRH